MKVVLIAPDYGSNPKTGAGQRTQLLFTSLLQHSNVSKVDVLLLGEEGYLLDKSVEFFSGKGCGDVFKVRSLSRGSIGIWKIFRMLNPRLIDSLATAFGRRHVGYSAELIADLPINLNDYDLIVGRYLRVTAMTGCFEEQVATSVLLDIDDRDDVLYSSRLETQGISLPARWMLNWHLQQVKSIQKKLLPKCQHSWVASEHDLHVLPTVSESVLPNIPYTLQAEINELKPIQTGNHQLLFVGSFGHRINREGVEWFLSNCWDALCKAIPDVSLRIVGSGGWENIDAKYKEIEGVEVVGFCESLEDEYQRAALTIAPLFEGGGTKIKVLESFLFGRVAFGASHAYVGYEYLQQIGVDIWPKSAEDFVEKLAKLLRNSEQINALASKGQVFVKDNFSFSAFRDAVHKEIK